MLHSQKQGCTCDSVSGLAAQMDDSSSCEAVDRSGCQAPSAIASSKTVRPQSRLPVLAFEHQTMHHPQTWPPNRPAPRVPDSRPASHDSVLCLMNMKRIPHHCLSAAAAVMLHKLLLCCRNSAGRNALQGGLSCLAQNLLSSLMDCAYPAGADADAAGWLQAVAMMTMVMMTAVQQMQLQLWAGGCPG